AFKPETARAFTRASSSPPQSAPASVPLLHAALTPPVHLPQWTPQPSPRLPCTTRPLVAVRSPAPSCLPLCPLRAAWMTQRRRAPPLSLPSRAQPCSFHPSPVPFSPRAREAAVSALFFPRAPPSAILPLRSTIS